MMNKPRVVGVEYHDNKPVKATIRLDNGVTPNDFFFVDVTNVGFHLTHVYGRGNEGIYLQGANLRFILEVYQNLLRGVAPTTTT